MSSRDAASWLAWSMWALSLGLTALSLFLLDLNRSYPNVYIVDYWPENVVATVTFSALGAVIASHLPNNILGWIYCTIGLLGGVAHFCAEYATYSLLAVPRSFSGAEASAWIASWLWVPYLGLYEFAALLFPTGRPLSRRWWTFIWFSVAVEILGTVSVAFSPGSVYGLGPIQNPLGIEDAMNAVGLVSTLVLALWLVAGASLFVRLHRSRGVERQQIKWATYTAAVAISGAFLERVIAPLTGIWWFYWVSFTIEMLGLIALPISIGIAILRYRLYQIDIVINRTLVYGSLTASLALVYFVSVLSLNQLFLTLIGQSSTLTIVASTLAIAALFNPLRRRIQSFVDRFFYRRKYDAAKTLEAFSARLRNETDLDTLSDHLVGVVQETMQPAHVSLWLRPSEEGASRKEPLAQEKQQR